MSETLMEKRKMIEIQGDENNIQNHMESKDL